MTKDRGQPTADKAGSEPTLSLAREVPTKDQAGLESELADQGCPPQRTWTHVGEQLGGDVRPELEAAIDQIEWRTPVGDWPAGPGLAIKELIRDVQVPHVDLAGISTMLVSSGRYTMLGVQGHYQNGRVRIYAVDRGGDLIVVASDFWPGEKASP